MKILHVAQDPEMARVPSGAIHGIAQNVTLAHAGSPADALEWLRQNTDAAAVVVEVEAQSGAPFVRDLRAARFDTPVVVVGGSGRLDTAVAALNSGADGYLPAGPPLERELPVLVAQAIDRANGRTRERAEVAAEQAAQRQQLARESRTCAALQQQSLQLENALVRLDKRRADEAAAFAELFDVRRRAFDERYAQALECRDMLATELAAARSALEREREARAADCEAARAAHDESERRHADEMAAATDKLADLESRHEAALEEHAAVSEAHDVAYAALERRMAEAQSQYLDMLERERDARAADCDAARAAHVESERLHANMMAAAGARLADLESRHKTALEKHAALSEEHDVAYAALERRLADAQSQHQTMLERAAADRAAAEEDLAVAVDARRESEQRANRIIGAALAREAELIGELETESAAKAVAQSQASAARMAAARGRDRSLLVVFKYRQHVRAERLERESNLRRAMADTERLQLSFEELQLAFHQLDSLSSVHAAARVRLEAVVAERDSQLAEEAERHLVALDELSRDHAAACVRLEAVVTERDRQLAEEKERHLIALDELSSDHTAARARLEAVVAERDGRLAEQADRHLVAAEETERAMARLRKDADALQRELDDTRGHAEALRDVADLVPDLEAELKKSRQEKRRQFERAPYGLCRCSANGTIIEANHSFVALLGYRRAEDIRELSWLTVTRERTGDLGWLLDRARATRKAEAVETHWTTREGRRVIVRLQALVTSEGAIDIVAEDVTTLRSLEEQLRQAQKMEAVGRLASEVAVTCDAVLGDVDREAREWIERLESVDLRISAERMMEEVTKARGFLRRLDTYGDEQKRALEPVSAKRVLGDLAPVLRRLVGERISLILPKSAGLFPVDVDAERLERVLTNVAGYARERMPMGGQVKIDLATIAIGRRFAAGHSNVRAGDHVLITVTELPSAGTRHTDLLSPARPPDRVGMELGVLVELISSCGGHLWLEAQPAGNMVLKIHLPRLAIKENRAGRLSQWLRAASVANIVT